MTKDEIRKMQWFLARKGYQIAVDGILGPETKSAQADWQSGLKTRNPQAWNDAHGKAKTKLVHQILDFAKLFHNTYLYGGEHDASFQDDDPGDLFDCSSSVSFLLWHFGLLDVSYAQVSTWFETYGEPGRGRFITIHSNPEHVWIEFNLDGKYYRFDTSPHGDGERGPRLRTGGRSDMGFVHRHPPGL